jgi:integrase
MTLTNIEIQNAKARAKPYKMSDGGWLFLFVTPKGAKIWRLAYRFDGREKTVTIGPYPEISLKDARKGRDEIKAMLRSGLDPAQQKKLDKLTKEFASATTFRVVADEYLDKLRREGRAQATLEKNGWLLSFAMHQIGERPVKEITAPEVLAALKSVEKRGRLETAKKMRGMIGAVFRFAIATARAEHDPTGALKGALVAPKSKRRAAILDPIKLGAFLRAVDEFDGQPETVAALKLLPMVFTRPGELRLAEWREFDLDKAIWTIPAQRTKMRREHQVPLAHQALAILADLKKMTGEGRLVFPGIRSRQRPISENTLNASMRRMGFNQDEVSAHGFRATASTLLNESGKFSADAIERALAHQDPDPVRRAYARGAFWVERVEMAQWWAEYLGRLKAGGEVAQFRNVRNLV